MATGTKAFREKRTARVTGITRASAGPVIACLEHGPGGIAVARLAALLAERLGARLILATVVRPGGAAGSGDRTEVGRGRRLVERIARELDGPAERHVASGEPAERLIALASRRAAGLIVIGAPGPDAAAPSPLGNAFLALAGVGACPVVLVPRGIEADLASGGPIACHVDGSPASLPAVRFAAALCDALGTKLELVDATGTPPGAALDLPRLIVTASSQSRPGVAGHVAAGRQPLVVVPSPVPPRFRPQRLVMTSRRLRGGEVLRVSGEIDMSSSPELEQQAMEVLAGAAGRLVLDLSEIDFIDVAGLRTVHRLARRAGELGGQLVIVATTRPVRRILELVPCTDFAW